MVGQDNFEKNQAIKIGSVCIITYMLNYYMRQILGVVTPSMLEENVFTKDFIALMSSAFFIMYASGQLINGIIGDIVKPKCMILTGFILCGLALFSFSFINIPVLQILCFMIFGVGSSMMRGPLVKLISENNTPSDARILCALFSVSLYCSPMITALFAMFFKWKDVFRISGIIALLTALLSFLILSYYERRGIIKYNIKTKGRSEQKSEQKHGGFFKIFFIKNFIVYMLLGMIFEISATSISFWIPTFVNEHLDFSVKASGVIFSGISLIRSLSPIICLVLFKLFKENDIKLIRIMLLSSFLLFVLMIFTANKWLSIILFIAALIATGCASSVLWTVFIPGLAKSGKVSSANGILDCSGYIGAALANVLFANMMGFVGWTGIIATWGTVMLIGFLITLFARQNNMKSNTPIARMEYDDHS